MGYHVWGGAVDERDVALDPKDFGEVGGEVGLVFEGGGEIWRGKDSDGQF